MHQEGTRPILTRIGPTDPRRMEANRPVHQQRPYVESYQHRVLEPNNITRPRPTLGLET